MSLNFSKEKKHEIEKRWAKTAADLQSMRTKAATNSLSRSTAGGHYSIEKFIAFFFLHDF